MPQKNVKKKNGKYHIKAETSSDWPDYQDTLHSANFFMDSWEAEATDTSYYVPGVTLSSSITSTNHVAGHFLMDYGQIQDLVINLFVLTADFSNQPNADKAN